MYINHQQKRILVEDLFTGDVEPMSHIAGRWSYANEPEIQRLIEDGYSFESVSSMWNTRH